MVAKKSAGRKKRSTSSKATSTRSSKIFVPCEPRDIDPRFAETVFMVEATHNETHNLWAQWSKEGKEFCTHGRFQDIYRRLDWEQDNPGYLYTVGWVDKRPVCVSFVWNRIKGHLVCFYEPTSQIVDHELVEKYINKIFKGTWDNGSRRAHCDAMNFGHCIQHLRSL